MATTEIRTRFPGSGYNEDTKVKWARTLLEWRDRNYGSIPAVKLRNITASKELCLKIERFISMINGDIWVNKQTRKIIELLDEIKDYKNIKDTIPHEWQEAISNYLASIAPQSSVSTTEVAVFLHGGRNYDITRSDQMVIGRILRNLGWRRYRHQARARYRRPAGSIVMVPTATSDSRSKRDFGDVRQRRAASKEKRRQELTRSGWGLRIKSFLDDLGFDTASTDEVLRGCLNMTRHEITRANQMHVADILRGLGWGKYRESGGDREWRYRRPGADPTGRRLVRAAARKLEDLARSEAALGKAAARGEAMAARERAARARVEARASAQQARLRAEMGWDSE